MSDTKIAVTATTILNVSIYIFSNDNRAQKRDKICDKFKHTRKKTKTDKFLGYIHIRLNNIKDELFI